MHRGIHARVVRTAITVTLLTAGLLASGASPAAAALSYVAELSDNAVVPGPGYPGASGVAEFHLDPAEGTVCVNAEFVGLDAFTGVAISTGDAGVVGTQVVSFPAPEEGEHEFYSDCVAGLEEGVVSAIRDDPTAHYIQVTSANYPDGAIRGQIELFDSGIYVNVAKYACPGKVHSLADIDPVTFAPCANVARTGDIEPVPGYRFDPKPILFDLQLSVTDSAGTRTLDDAELDGGGVCNPDTRTCSMARSYAWFGVAAGPLAVTEVTVPSGYRFGAALVFIDGDPADATVNVATRTVTLETTPTVGQASVVIFDFRGPSR